MKKMRIAAISALALSGIVQARTEGNGLYPGERPEPIGMIRPLPAPVGTGSETHRHSTGAFLPVMPGRPLDKVTLESLVDRLAPGLG